MSFSVNTLKENVSKTRHVHLKKLFDIKEPWMKVLEEGPLSGKKLEMKLVTNFIMYVGTDKFCYLMRTITDFPKLQKKDVEQLTILRLKAVRVVNHLKMTNISCEFKDHGFFVILHLLCYKLDEETRIAWFRDEEMSPTVDNLLQFINGFIKL